LLLLTAALPVTGWAEPLDVSEVELSRLNCLFARDCTPIVEDFGAGFEVPGGSPEGTLRSRILVGEAGLSGARLRRYEYQIDLAAVHPSTARACVTFLVVEFAAHAPFDFDEDGDPDDIYVITHGDEGSVRPRRVVQMANTVAFTFSPEVCPGESSFFMGLVSTEPPKEVRAEVGRTLAGSIELTARGPSGHPGMPPPPPRSDCYIPGVGGVPRVPHFVPLCRCLEDASLRELRCAFLHPDFLLERRVPWPLRAGESFGVDWSLTPFVAMSGPLAVEEHLPPSFRTGRQGGPRMEFKPTATDQAVTARIRLTASPQPGKYESQVRVVPSGGASETLKMVFLVEPTEPPPATARKIPAVGLLAGTVLFGLALLWLAIRRRRG